MMVRWFLAVAVMLTSSPTVEAGWFRRACRPRVAPACRTAPGAAYAARGATFGGGAVSQTHPPVQAPPTAPQAAGDAGEFLARLNAWRAAHGRRPVGWDAGLAAYAACNTWAGHSPQSMAPGAGQCWASHRSLVAALEAWQRSPAHAAILLNATVAVGASVCPSGSTCNAR